MGERRQLTVIGPDGERSVEAIIAVEPPWSLSLDFGAGSIVEAEAADLFAALEAIRTQLEPMGVRVCCAGARSDVFPSGMARQMAGGRRAYRLRPDQRPTRDDLVDIFDPAEPDEVVTVQEQIDAVERLRGR